jgi:hypothetical protein
MIAILNTEQEAIQLSNDIHEWLKINRQGYNAEGWSNLDKSDSEELWAVPIPNDYDYEGVETLPYNWRIETEEQI